ncbi:fumarylacetoacetate hydrolase family protein [Marinobacteraceae bacterium S3BR75-40.1]
MSAFHLRYVDGAPVPFTLGKIVCVGRNYAAHAAELNNPIPDKPLLFMKPATAACDLAQPLDIPKALGSVHFETELAVLIGKELKKATPEAVPGAIAGWGLALDLTLRDIQSELKEKGHPWERAKAFDGACPLSAFLPADRLDPSEAIAFSLEIDGKPRQSGNTANMLTPIAPLIAAMSQSFTLQPGDVILTGTPEGVGELQSQQQLKLALEDQLVVETHVA